MGPMAPHGGVLAAPVGGRERVPHWWVSREWGGRRVHHRGRCRGGAHRGGRCRRRQRGAAASGAPMGLACGLASWAPWPPMGGGAAPVKGGVSGSPVSGAPTSGVPASLLYGLASWGWSCPCGGPLAGGLLRAGALAGALPMVNNREGVFENNRETILMRSEELIDVFLIKVQFRK